MNSSTTALVLTPDAAIDLHMHTIYSDGRWTPQQLMDHLVSERFSLVAITDHDRTDTIAGIQQLAREKHLPILVGAEMSTTWKNEMVDLLCFGFEPGNTPLSELAQDLFRRQQENTRHAFEYLRQQGLTLPPEALSTILTKPSAEQPHCFMPLLQEHGYDLGDPAVRKAVRESGIDLITNEPGAVVDTAHRSGGVCLLAHPGHGDGFVTFDVQLLDEFRQIAPVDGLEVYHPKNSPVQTEMYLEYAQRNHLLISAGSDSHKPEKPPIKYRAELCRQLLERVGIRIKA